jgi:sugar lactone lactonase YvrE
MKPTKIISLVAVAALLGWHASAQNYDTNGDYVQTFAGSGFSGYLDGVGQLTMFNYPNAIVADSSSNLFVLDSGNYRIRKIAPDGTVSTFAGGGGGGLPGYGTNVSLFSSFGSMTIDHSNALWIISGFSLLRIGSNAYVSNIVLNGLSGSSGVCVDSGNNIYYSTYNGNQIYRWRTNGVLELFAGSGNSGAIDGNGIFTSFSNPSALAADAADNIYVWDSGNNLIRRIDQSRNVTTLAGIFNHSSNADGVGTNATFYGISSMCSDNAGNIYIALGLGGSPGSYIRKMNAQTNVVTMAGSFTQTGYTNGAGKLARFGGAQGVCISGGTIYVADSSNQRIRSITNNPQPQTVSGANLGIGTFAGITITGLVGRTYQIQTSPDMNAWTTRATLLLTSSPYLWIDQNPVSGNKFYRALLLP